VLAKVFSASVWGVDTRQPYILCLLAISSWLIALAPPLQAEVKLPEIFGTYMVLQQEMTVPLWGTADPGEHITVVAGDHSGTAIADAQGKWRINLAAFPPKTPRMTVSVYGKNLVEFDDVLIGDVWLASGQSNMEYCLRGAHNIKDIEDHLADDELRVFMADHAYALEPATDLRGHWEVAGHDSLWNFSAIAYFFGHELRQALDRPIGLIETSFGGTIAQSWTSVSGLAMDPPFKGELDVHDANLKALPTLSADYGQKVAGFQGAITDWQAKYGDDLNRRRIQWQQDAQAARVAGKPVPPDPQPGAPLPQQPPDELGGRNGPGNLFNGMIAPLIPYAIKGIIWHQGEFNVGAAVEYRTLFPRLITDWRDKWGEGNIPFLYVQLAALGDRDVVGGGDWPLLQEAQGMARSLPNVGMATSIDIGDRNTIHPADKFDVGQRLAKLAYKIAYGKNVVAEGPTFDKMTIEGSAARISFTNPVGYLVVRPAPWTAPDAYSIPTTSLVGFVVAGADKKFFTADAKIDGNTVIVSSPQVPQPVAVRYDFANITIANLYNNEGLPAYPFRTDTWDDIFSPATPPQMVPGAP
jgi:sialate O-acetylesterase